MLRVLPIEVIKLTSPDHGEVCAMQMIGNAGPGSFFRDSFPVKSGGCVDFAQSGLCRSCQQHHFDNRLISCLIQDRNVLVRDVSMAR